MKILRASASLIGSAMEDISSDAGRKKKSLSSASGIGNPSLEFTRLPGQSVFPSGMGKPLSEELKIFFDACVTTIGNFDGVHLGHRALLHRAVEEARKTGLPSVAVTFEPHPSVVLSSNPPKVLCSFEQRMERMEKEGVDFTLVLPFSRVLAAETSDSFCRRILKKFLHTHALFIGHDFRMGSDFADAAHIAESGRGIFSVTQIPAVLDDGEPVSSTRIRSLLEKGDLAGANRLLGEPFSLRGEIVHGEGRGGPLLGIPTANLALDSRNAVPLPSVYATSVRFLTGKFAGKVFASVTSFGRNPTFGGNRLTLETHLLDFSADVYGEQMELVFLCEMRKECRFDGLESLKKQLFKDIHTRRVLFPY